MVDFNNETTITRPKQDTIQYLLIENQSYCFDALEAYNRQIENGEQPVIEPTLKARIKRLYLMMLPTLDDNKKNSDEIIEKYESKLIGDIIELFKDLNKILYEIGVTKFTARKTYDPNDPTEEDEEKEV